MNKEIQIGLVDDDQLIVELLSDFFEKQEDISVCMKAYSGNTCLSKLETQTVFPDMILLDLKMKDGDGLEAIEVLSPTYPKLKIIVLSSNYRLSFTGYMLKIGIHAFLPKGTDKKTLLSAIRSVSEIGYYLTNEQVNVLREKISSKKPAKLGFGYKKLLSERELEVLQLICQQYTAKEMAKKLFVSTKTIEAHKGNLLSKINVKNTAGLIIYAIQNNIVNPNELPLLD